MGLGFGSGASCEGTVGMGVGGGSGSDAFFPLGALPWVMKEPPSIKAEPIAWVTAGEGHSDLCVTAAASGPSIAVRPPAQPKRNGPSRLPLMT